MSKLNFIKHGRGPTVVLSHALGCDLGMWDEVAAKLVPDFTVLRYDHFGHGKSEIVLGRCSIENMADDAAALIDAQVAGEVHFVGIAMGGVVAQRIAMRHPQLISSIVVANSSSYYDEAQRRMLSERIRIVNDQGVAAIADTIVQRWFTPEFLRSSEGARSAARLRTVLESTNPKSYVAACEAISRIEFFAANPQIACPTLVIAGTRDESTPMEMAEAIRNTISGAQLATIDAAHLSAVEKPIEFAELVANFIHGL